MNRSPKIVRSLLYLAVGTTSLLRAQTSPSPAPLDQKKAGQEVIELSPFSVNTEKDSGYIATDSLLGGRLSTALLKTPSDVTVLTRDFLNDLGATDYITASPFLTNTYVIPVAGQDFGAQNNFRGLGGGFPTRNYFKHNDSLDYYNVERVESARGPNALLFGDGIVGGVINTVTKQAKPGRRIAEVSLRVDSEGSLRATADYNVSLNKDSAIRVNLVRDDDRSWVNTYFKKRNAATIAATFHPWKSDELRFEVEIGDLDANWATQSFTDQVSTWNGVSFVGPSTTVPTGAVGVGRFTTDRLTYIQGIGMVNLLNFGQTQGSNLAIDPSKNSYVAAMPKIARDLSLQAPNFDGTVRRTLVAGFYQHQWAPGLNSEFAYQYANYARATNGTRPTTLQVDINTTLPSGVANPYFGKMYADVVPLFQIQENQHFDSRFVTAYELPIHAWKQTLNAMLSRRVEYFLADDSRWVRNNNPADPKISSSANQYNYRTYVTPGNAIPVAPDRPANDSIYTWENLNTRHRDQRQQLDTMQLATVANIWDERITFIGGYRHDNYQSREFAIGTFDAITGRPSTVANLRKKIKANVFSSGVTYFPVQSFGFYANISETFNPIGAGDPALDGSQFNQTDGLGYSGGIRYKLFDGKLVGSAGYYDVSEKGRTVGFANTEINRIWGNINQAQFQLPTAYRDTLDIASKGYEVDFVYNISKNFRLKANYGRPKTKQSNALPGTIKYYNTNLPIWTAALANPATQNVAQVQSDIAALVTRIQSGNEGRALNGQADYSGSIFGNYTVASGALNRLSFGGGVAVVGPRIVGNSVTNAFDYIKSPKYYTVNGTLGYSLKLFERNVRLQLNVSNLLDYNKPVYTNVGTLAGKNYLNNFYYFEPRKFLLSATIEL